MPGTAGYEGYVETRVLVPANSLFKPASRYSVSRIRAALANPDHRAAHRRPAGLESSNGLKTGTSGPHEPAPLPQSADHVRATAGHSDQSQPAHLRHTGHNGQNDGAASTNCAERSRSAPNRQSAAAPSWPGPTAGAPGSW
eukprot:SAG31_NODE_2092_length_6464_cov_3.597172_9_plen_141_part_00